MNELKPLAKAGKNAYNIVGFDTEDNGKGAPESFLVACFHTDKGAKVFWDRMEARKFVFGTDWAKKGSTIFFAHNLQYDLMNIDYPEGVASTLITAKGMIGAKFRQGNHSVRMMDTQRFFNSASVKDLGEFVGCPKLEYDIKKLRGVRAENLSDDEKKKVEAYCARDAEIVYKVGKHLIGFAGQYKTKFKCMSAASLALRIWRTSFLERSIPKNIYSNFERQSYYGGRTEVYDRRMHPSINNFDINSSYPSIALKCDYPNPATAMTMDKPLWKDVCDMHGLSIVKVKVERQDIPPLPCRDRRNGLLLFPYGEWLGAYTHPELRMAERYGAKIIEVKKSLIYYQSFNPFRKFMEHFYQRKSESEGIAKELYKNLMVSLLGKFSERRYDYKRVYCDALDSITSRKVEDVEPDIEGWYTLQNKSDKQPAHSIPILTAYTTAHGRMKLYEEGIQQCDEMSYVDTDATFTEECGISPVGDAIGQWKKQEIHDFKAYSPKCYMSNERRATKGIPASAVLHEVGEKHLKQWEFERPVRMVEAQRLQLPPNLWIEAHKWLNNSDCKRKMLPNGGTEPLKVVYTSFLENCNF